MSNVKFICSKCGSDNVEHAMWVNPNTNVVGDLFGSWNEEDSAFCNHCESHGTLTQATLRSERGFILVGTEQLTPDQHILTVELYDKWYNLYLVSSDSNVRKFGFDELEKYARGNETAYCDHAPNPEIVERCAEECGFYLPSLALELITGRWKLEHG